MQVAMQHVVAQQHTLPMATVIANDSAVTWGMSTFCAKPVGWNAHNTHDTEKTGKEGAERRKKNERVVVA